MNRVEFTLNFGSMFASSQFNCDISNWNVSNVKDMRFMFSNSKFNGDISKWHVFHVQYMCRIFEHFQWDIRNIEDIFTESNNSNIPYWANFEKREERIFAYDNYLLQQQLNTDLSPKSGKKDKKLKL